MVVYDSSLDHPTILDPELCKEMFGQYEVWELRNNRTYQLSELGGSLLRTPIARNRMKIFKKRNEAESYVDLNGADTDKEANMNQKGKSEDSGSRLELII